MPIKRTTAEFIEKALSIHGTRYTYDMVQYTASKTKVTITCPDHGEFKQQATSHLLGHGCPACSGKLKSNVEGFIKKAEAVHGDKYMYGNVQYINASTKVTITCPSHGDFSQTPCNHLSGFGCPKCGGSQRLGPEEWISNARAVHGDKYLYGNVKYRNTSTKVTITCPDHGDFAQTPRNHTNGYGCPTCGGKLKLTTESFIKKAQSIHGHKYLYDHVRYRNIKTCVTITCLSHGDFEQKPHSHLQGAGCPVCAGTSKSTTSDFVEKAIAVHGGRYQYDKVQYAASKTKVTITCPFHGDFEQRPGNHLSGARCPSCAGSSVSRAETEWLDQLGVDLRQHRIELESLNVVVDGYEPATNTVYEFLGDFWHGNPNLYAATDVNPVTKVMFGQMFLDTQERLERLKHAGFNVKAVWESDFRGIQG